MPIDRAVYPEPPTQSPEWEKKSSVPDPNLLIGKVFYYAVDKPVTLFREFIESQRAKRKIYYYHRVFQRVPYLSECLEDDLFCQFEAEMQWRRDKKVDEEIMKIMRARYTACITREGPNSKQNCAEMKEQYAQVCRGFKSRYEYLGANGNARKCLIKQKERMIKEQKAAAEAQT